MTNKKPTKLEEPKVNRSLTAEAIRLNLESVLDSELKQIPEDLVIEVSLPVLNADGSKKRDGNGYLVTELRKVLKRDHHEITRKREIEKIVLSNTPF